MEFWTSWALWEKMCFVLGCAIVVTILAGCLKLVHKHWQLRKYTALAAKKREQQQQIQHTMSMRRMKDPEVPFGVRAIESGIEVDGVWISRSNTPDTGSPASLAISTLGDRGLSSETIPSLSMPQPAHPYPSSSRGRSMTGSSSDESFERAVSAETLSSRDGSPARDNEWQRRPNYQPRQSSQLRFSSGEVMRDTTLAGAADDRTSDSLSAAEKRRLQYGSGSSSSSTASSESGAVPDHYVPQRPHHSNASSTYCTGIHEGPIDRLPFTRDSRADLDSLANHRRYHAAETGQLLPRSQSGGVGGEPSSLKSTTSDRTSPAEENLDDVAPHLQNPFESSSHNVISESIPVDPPSFQSFVESSSANFKGQSQPLMHNWDHVELGEQSEKIHVQRPPVVRKVNSGFEILRPGTLNKHRQSSDIVESKRDINLGTRGQSNRLMKKSRSGSTSTRNSQAIDHV